MYLCEEFTNGQIERVDDVAQTGQRAHVVGGGQVFVVRVVGLQDVLAVTVFGDHAQQVLVVTAIVLPGILGRRGGYLIGWIYQVALLGLSIFIATINGVGVFYIVLSIIFLSLWIWAMLAGSTIDAARVAWQKANGIDPNNPDGQPEVFRIETDSEEK